MQHVREALERRQVSVYLGAVAAAALVATNLPSAAGLQSAVNPVLALMLFATFLQVPLAALLRAFVQWRFLAALLVANFVVTPILVALLVQCLPADPLLRLGVLMVFLTPCIDYVVTFAHLGRADAPLLLAATPVLLVVQMLLLPGYISVLLGGDAAHLMRAGPFVQAFAWLIVMPLALAAVTQAWMSRSRTIARIATALGMLPVPTTALVLFVVVASVLPQVGAAAESALRVLPIYIAFSLLAPMLGWLVARAFRLAPAASRSIAFSAGTRNSLVVLPLALAVPGAMPVLPAIIVTQTLVELLGELVYVRVIATWGAVHDQ